MKQPWAWAIAAGYKRVENRTRGVSYRGPLALHAGGAWSKTGAGDTRVMDAALHSAEGLVAAAVLVLGGAPVVCPRGAVIAVCDLIDSHPAADCCAPWGDSEYLEGDHARPVHHLVLNNIRPLAQPIPARGQLGLWRPNDDLTRAIKEGTS